MSRARKCPTLELPGLNPEWPSSNVTVVAEDGETIVVTERASTKSALRDVVELLVNGLTFGSRRIDIKKVKLTGNSKSPCRKYLVSRVAPRGAGS